MIRSDKVAAFCWRSEFRLSIALLGFVWLGISLLSSTVWAQSAKLIEDAKKEGEVVWYTSQLDDVGYNETRKAFNEKYGVKLTIVSGASGGVYQRLAQDMQMGTARADVLSTATVGHFIDLKKQGQLVRYVPDNLVKVDPAFRNYGDDNFYHPTVFTLLAIAYNTNKVSSAEAPKSWKELLDPKWQGKIAMGHPGFSGTIAEWAATMVKLYGWDYFETLNKRAPLIGRSVNDGITSIVSGERLVTPTLASSALASGNQGNPIKLSYPEDGAVLVIQPSAILKTAPHPNAAKLLLEFLLDQEFGRIAMQSGMAATIMDAPMVPGLRKMSEIKFLAQSPQESLDGTALVISKWQGTFGQ